MKRAHLISNPESGQGGAASIGEVAARLCSDLGYELINYDISDPQQIDQKAEAAVNAAAREHGLVIAAGGDGTLRTVAQKACGKDIDMGIVPLGTFNYFSRTHNVSQDMEEALRLALTGRSRPVRLGEINDQVFLINTCMGLYAKAIRERETRMSRWGRNRFVVLISSIISALGRHHLLNVNLIMHQKSIHYKTPMIFVGNNAFQLKNLQMSVAQCMKNDHLALVMMKPLTKLDVLRIIYRGLRRTIEKEERLECYCVDSLTIETRKPKLPVVLDGEIFYFKPPLKIQVLPKVLNLVIPAKEDE